MKSSVMNSVVERDLCIGCGLCAALCPQDVLTMQWNRYGEYNPVAVSPCTTECGLCLKVCPFADSGENEDIIAELLYGAAPGIQHRSETGYYLASYVGYSEKHRPASASGGMATWLLEVLLAEGVVDHVICVAPTGDPERLFTFQVFDTPEDVRTGAGSAYYPVELSAVIRQVIEVPGRYAVTGLPCFLKAIRLAQQRNKKLRERVVVTVGLVCGQLKSRHFTDYIATLAGVQGEVMGVHYRGKSPDRPASNFYFSFTAADGEERKIFWNEGIAEAWTNRWFTPAACSYCDDVFAECADVTCMDAWLPEYSRDSRGTSLVLVRSPAVREVLERGQGFVSTRSRSSG
jgi:coenzyme F420 hydrogenase subunit beta